MNPLCNYARKVLLLYSGRISNNAIKKKSTLISSLLVDHSKPVIARDLERNMLLFVATATLSVHLSQLRSRTNSARSYSFSSDSSSSCSPAPLIDEEVPRKKSTIYTKTGDKGTSSLYNLERRPKNDVVFEALGHQDELNAVLGVAREYCDINKNGLGEMLAEIQSRLFDLGAAVATPVRSSSEEKKAYTEFPSQHTERLELWIDNLDCRLPPLSNFVIPSGGLTSTHLNLARTVCRRAERAVVSLVNQGDVDAEVGRYLNRLSDFLFVAARTASAKEGTTEILWKKTESS